ncbi:hypothetical protein [Pseudodesulfovibrio karagichevae]|uniref:Uncharacterized protein n=1 Tax=Pseudodesulfovibrio karagichevae TaxID=3239305 RepID=A0ABV4K4H9_9BACT
MKGFDELDKKLKRLENNAKQMDGTREVSLVELFPSNFMSEYTSFADIQEFFDFVDIDLENEELGDSEVLQTAIRERTQFSSWQEMLEQATVTYVEKQLLKGM